MDCLLYQRAGEWFLSLDLPIGLGGEEWEGLLAQDIVDRVGTRIAVHHKDHTNWDEDLLVFVGSEQAWRKLEGLLGPHRQILRQKYKQVEEDGWKLSKDEEHGFELEYWALTSPDLAEAVDAAYGVISGETEVDSILV